MPGKNKGQGDDDALSDDVAAAVPDAGDAEKEEESEWQDGEVEDPDEDF